MPPHVAVIEEKKRECAGSPRERERGARRERGADAARAERGTRRERGADIIIVARAAWDSKVAPFVLCDLMDDEILGGRVRGSLGTVRKSADLNIE